MDGIHEKGGAATPVHTHEGVSAKELQGCVTADRTPKGVPYYRPNLVDHHVCDTVPEGDAEASTEQGEVAAKPLPKIA